MKLEEPLHRLSGKEKEEITRKIRKTLEKRSEACFAYLFGSFIRHNSVRDIDVAIWVKRGSDPLEEAIKLSEELGREGDQAPRRRSGSQRCPSDTPLQHVQGGWLILLREECRNIHDNALVVSVLEYADLREKYRVLSRLARGHG